MRIQSILVLQRGLPNREMARDQAVHHAGAEEALSFLITMIGDAINEEINDA